MQGYFIFDLIPCIPLQYIDMDGEEKIFYLLKIMRMYVGIQFMDISAIIAYIGKYNSKIRLKKMIETNPFKANDTSQDNTLMSYVLIAKYCLRLVKLVILIMTITYFLGMFWYIISLELDHATAEYRSTADPLVVNVETYIMANNLQFLPDDPLQ